MLRLALEMRPAVFMREQIRQFFPELEIMRDDHRDRGGHHLVDILVLQRLGQPFLGFRCFDEETNRAGQEFMLVAPAAVMS